MTTPLSYADSIPESGWALKSLAKRYRFQIALATFGLAQAQGTVPTSGKGLPPTFREPCLAHKMRITLCKLPGKVQEETKRLVEAGVPYRKLP